MLPRRHSQQPRDADTRTLTHTTQRISVLVIETQGQKVGSSELSRWGLTPVVFSRRRRSGQPGARRDVTALPLRKAPLTTRELLLALGVPSMARELRAVLQWSRGLQTTLRAPVLAGVQRGERGAGAHGRRLRQCALRLAGGLGRGCRVGPGPCRRLWGARSPAPPAWSGQSLVFLTAESPARVFTRSLHAAVHTLSACRAHALG